MERSSGILLPLFSLPSPYGIGTMGKEAYAFADFLHQAGQRWWQMLPLGPTGYGDSPYQTFSSFAGNPNFIDLTLLYEDGLLTREELDGARWKRDDASIDYGMLDEIKWPLLRRAAERGLARNEEKNRAFAKQNSAWLDDYAMYMALRNHFGKKPWSEWPDEGARLHESAALERWRGELSDEIALYAYLQYLFYTQWDLLREYVRALGIGLIGDLPIYVPMDSADVWANHDEFQLDEKNVPTAVAGVPPDYFCADGQLWGNPLYDWGKMEKDGFGWWIRRIEGSARLFDVLRLDHFRGLSTYWAVPYGETTAKNGVWRQGPGMKLVRVLSSWFPNVHYIAEDLGILTPDVGELLKESGMPGMKVLEFAFSAGRQSDYMPHCYCNNCVCYIGTHDNVPVQGWRTEALREDVAMAEQYLGLNEKEGFHWGMIRGGMSSVADLFIMQMQDCLGLDAKARTNTPGTPTGNWRWRMTQGQMTPELAKKLKEMTALYGRIGAENKNEKQ